METERGWAALDRFAVRERSERLAAALRAVEPQLSDFEVMPPAAPQRGRLFLCQGPGCGSLLAIAAGPPVVAWQQSP